MTPISNGMSSTGSTDFLMPATVFDAVRTADAGREGLFMRALPRPLVFLFLVFWAASAVGQSLGTFRDWRAHRFKEKEQAVCTMWSQPKTAEGKYTRRGEIFVLVSHRPSEKRTDSVSFEMGYPFAAGKTLAVSIDGGKAMRLPASGSLAWHESPDVNRRLVRLMRAGRKMKVTGRSSRGTKTVDTYSLLGFTKAYKAISEACGVR